MSTERQNGLPFAVSRSSRVTLVEQVATGLRRCIMSGFYKPGDVLPTTRDLAEMLGVSRIVTRAAVRELADAELINPRPSVGCVVLGSGERRWKGHVLLVLRNNVGGYYADVFAAVLRSRLVKDGWLCTSICVMEPSGGQPSDLAELRASVANPVNLAIVLFDNPAAEKFLSGSGIPFVVLGDKKTCRLRGCKGYLHYDRAAQGERFAAACLAQGVKSVVHVGTRDFDDVRTALRKVGIGCKSWLLDEPPPDSSSDVYAELARDAFVDYLKSGKSLPDAFYFSDDYLCAGALAALSDAGIRAPQDVRIATWANHGNVPIYARALSRIELNPWKDAEDTYAFCRSILSGKTPGKPPVLAPVWIKGATMGGPSHHMKEEK